MLMHIPAFFAPCLVACRHPLYWDQPLFFYYLSDFIADVKIPLFLVCVVLGFPPG